MAGRRRVLLDECVPQGLRHALAEFEVETAEHAGLAGTSNGALIAAAERRFDVIVTIDKRLRFQQNLTGYRISVVVLLAPSARLVDLMVHVDALRAAVRSIGVGEIVEVG